MGRDVSTADGEHERLHRAGSAWTDRGTAHLLSGLAVDRAESIRCHGRAIGLLGQLPIGEDASYLADLGTAWVNLGCALMADGAPDSLGQAREAFDRAIEIIERLSIGDTPRFRHNLAAAWMNRADAAADRRDALRGYHRAIEIAGGLPLDEKAAFRVLLASSWINLGNLHLRTSGFFDAVLSYDGAIAALENLPGSGHRLACHHAATAWANRGEAFLRFANGEGTGQAVDSARRALALVEGRGLERGADAKLTLRALRVLASGLETLLRPGSAGADRVGELTDAAERGIGLALANRDAAPDVFEPFAVWFFSFGSRAYGRYQPQFLAEYLEETLRRVSPRENPRLAAELRTVARQATSGALEELGRSRLLVQGSRPTELLLCAVQGLRSASMHLSA
jgi:tetratricopeptide (TPR) repeat protein